MKFIILDLEATCWQGNTMGRQQEIIEIGAYRINGYGEWIDHFQAFVKPRLHPRLSTYCKDLTGIAQKQINQAKSFDFVFHAFEDWFYEHDGPTILCTWGDKDIPFIIEDCYQYDLDYSFLPKCIDLKSQYARIHLLMKEVGLSKALEYNDILFEGNPHRALDDAFNTTKLFLKYIDHWQY